MSNAQFNAQAQFALAQHLKGALAKSILRNGRIPSWTQDFKAAKNNVLKYKGEWLSEFDVADVVAELVRRKLPPAANNSSDPLSDFLDESTIAVVAQEIVEYIATIPRPYEIDFPLPKIEIEQDVVFAPYIRLVRSAPGQANALKALLTPSSVVASALPDTTYLRISASGFARDELRQSALRDALSHLKRFLQVAHIKYAFVRDFSRPESQIMAELLGAQPTERIHRAIVRDVASDSWGASSANLGRNLSSYLESLTLHTSRLGLAEPPLRLSSIAVDLLGLLAIPMSLFVHSDAAENCKSIRSALEWDFDASVDEDPPSSFIKTCIALEAALGEDTDEERITERLADRCAYLLHTTAVDRARTRKSMREIYRLRSKIVHGLKTTFSESDNSLAFWGRIHLARVLYQEIEALEKWWSNRQSGSE